MMNYGRLSIPSGILVLADPCYIGAEMLDQIRTCMGDGDELYRFINVGPATTGTVRYQLCPQTSRLAKVEIVFDEGRCHSMGEVGTVSVDSGQMSYCDAQHLLENWKKADYLDIRKYRHKEEGRILQYLVDFAHYEAPIASEGGSTMNALNASGEWESLPYDGPIECDYNGMSHCHDEEDGLGMIGDSVLVTDTGWGDGQYPIEQFMTSDGRLARLIITFIGEHDDEDEEE